MKDAQRRLFAMVTVISMILVAWQIVVRTWQPDATIPNTPPPVAQRGPPLNSKVPSSQGLFNATQTQGNCGSTWMDVQSSDNSYCKYREVNTAPATTALLPNANGDTVSWIVSGTTGCTSEASELDCVNDNPNDGDSTYIKSTASTVTDSIENLGTVSFAGATVSSVVVNIWCRKAVSQAVAVRTLIKTHSTLYQGAADFNCPNSMTYGTTSTPYTTNPNTGLAWTQAEVDALQAGCRDNDGTTREVRCSEVRVDVNFNARYSLEVQFVWSGVILGGDRYILNVECQRLNPGSENFLVQVGQGGSPPSTWSTAYTCNSDTDQTFNTYFLNAAELNGGGPYVRVWDNQGSTDTTQGTMALDVFRIDKLEYRTGSVPWYYYISRMVDADNGNLLLQSRDLTVKALGMDLDVTRSYNAFLASSDSLLGHGWTFLYDTRIIEEKTGLAQVWGGTGEVHTFRLSGSTWVAPPGVDAKLTKSTTFTLWSKDGTKLAFNTNNRLSTITDKNGNTLTLTWTSPPPLALTTVADASGLQLNFTSAASCSGTCHITQVQDPLGRLIKYYYDINGDLRTVKDAMGNNTYYTYDSSHRLLTWQDPVGRRVIFSYDASDRVTQIKERAVTVPGNTTIYEYVEWSVTYPVIALFQGADHSTNATNGRNVVATISVDLSGSPLDVKGPQCGECASLVQNLGGKGGGGCSGAGSLTEELILTWDSNRNMLTKKDKSGHQYAYTYDARRNQLNTTDPLGNVTRNVWTNNDNGTAYISTMNKTTNGRSFTWFSEYDGKGNVKQVKDPTNNLSKYQYTTAGYLNKTTDWRGFNTLYAYGSHGYMLNTTDATGNKTTFLNDAVGRMTRRTTPANEIWKFEYDKNDRLTKATDPLNNVTSYTYDARNMLVTRKDALGRTTQYSWNVTNLKISTTVDALGNSTNYAYDLANNVVKVTNPRGFDTTLSYDNFNRRSAVQDATGNQTQYTYDGDGRMTAIRNRRGYYTNVTYDALNRVKTVRDAAGNVTTFSYDQIGDTLKVTDARNYDTQYAFDALNRVTSMQDALGNTTKFGYDANGNLINRTDPNGNAEVPTFDGLNRRTNIRNGEGKNTAYVYDSESNVVQVRDANQKTTNMSYDVLDRVKVVTDGNGNTTKFEYDAVGNVLNVTDGNGHKTTRRFDSLNRLTSTSSPLGKTTNVTYDANGNVKTRKDPNGDTTTYTYDKLDQLAKTAYPNGQNLTFAYDAEGNRLTATGYGFTRTDVFDALNRVTSIAFNYGSFSKQVQYTYDQLGNRKTMHYPEGPWVNSTYDALDRLTVLSDSVIGSWTLTYDKASRLTRISYPSGLKTEFAYNKANWILGVYTNTSTPSVLESFVYVYGDAGNRLQMTENNGNVSTYGYDNAYQLKSESYAGGLTLNYTYDGAANRLSDKRNSVSTTYTYDNDNRLTAKGTTTFGYDNKGNQIRRTVGGQNTSYSYDFENRLTTVTFPNATTEIYQYSTDGNRISRTTGGVKAWFGYDFRDKNGYDDIIAEYNVTGSLVARYVQGPGIDQPFAVVRDGFTKFYSFDALGSVTRLTTASQATNARYRYEAFGASRDTLEGIANPYRFTSRELDSSTGLYYYRARSYDGGIGRFVSKDPAKSLRETNKYAYAGNNPANFVDPSGLSHRCNCGWWDWATAFGECANCAVCRFVFIVITAFGLLWLYWGLALAICAKATVYMMWLVTAFFGPISAFAFWILGLVFMAICLSFFALAFTLLAGMSSCGVCAHPWIGRCA